MSDELTTQQAADYLNVSRAFVLRLLDRGEIPYRVIARQHYVRWAELLAFEQKSIEARKQALAEMAAISQGLGLD